MIAFVSMRSFSPNGYDEPAMGISHNWINFLEKHSITPVLVPNSPLSLELLLKNIKPDLILLTNGDTVGSTKQNTAPSYPKRDETEEKIVGLAIQNRIPTLGVCRGLQFLNIYFGGTIEYQKAKANHVNSRHKIEFLDEGFKKALGLAIPDVNSYHGDGILSENLSPALKPLAQSPDGFIEALAHRQYPILGIQWHPERDSLSSGDSIVAYWKALK